MLSKASQALNGRNEMSKRGNTEHDAQQTPADKTLSTTASRRVIRYQGVVRFPSEDNRRGVTGLYLATEVTGTLTPAAWCQLQGFHERLNAPADGAGTIIEIIASRAILRQPRTWLTQTKFGIASSAVLDIHIERLHSARIPGHRWRSLRQLPERLIQPAVKHELRSPMTTSVATEHNDRLH